MKIGFYIKYPKFSIERPGNVLGEEILANSLCEGLRKLGGVEQVEVYAPNYLPEEELDAMVYLDCPLNRKWARKHYLYWQYSYDNNVDYREMLHDYHELDYDGYMFFSDHLLELHEAAGQTGILLPFGVDTESFIPQPVSTEFNHEVAYLGSYIKGKEITDRYLIPCLKFDFGLYGNWNPAYYRFRYWRNWPWLLPSRRRYMNISKGKLPQEKVPILYSSAKININFSSEAANRWNVISFRTYEVLACKGFLISDKNDYIEKELAGKVVFSEGGNDLRDKIEYYLAHEDERRRIAEAGYEYVQKKGSIYKRAEKLLGYISE